MKRDWIIPPIRVLENSKQVPEDLVQVKRVKVELFTVDFLQWLTTLSLYDINGS